MFGFVAFEGLRMRKSNLLCKPFSVKGGRGKWFSPTPCRRHFSDFHETVKTQFALLIFHEQGSFHDTAHHERKLCESRIATPVLSAIEMTFTCHCLVSMLLRNISERGRFGKVGKRYLPRLRAKQFSQGYAPTNTLARYIMRGTDWESWQAMPVLVC